ncbi:MAG: hypothetical protein KIS90_14800 [Phenylobacterium sp.]|nr:hypothetical protein [Phenylobacterium sp.]
MVKPVIAVDIVTRDKGDAGRKDAERKNTAWARRQTAIGESGVARIGKQVEALSKFRSLTLGVDGAGRSLTTIGQAAGGAEANVANLAYRLLSAGRAGETAGSKIASALAAATGRAAGLAAAVVGIGVGAYKLGEKWAGLGADLGNRARDYGVSAGALQRRYAAAERFGVGSDQVDAGYEGLGQALYDAESGENNLALGVLNQAGLKIRKNADGTNDVDGMMDDIADLIAKQRNPLVQRKLASVFGVSSMLPALRQGSGVLRAEGEDYARTGAAFTDDEIAKATETRRQAARLRQQLSAIEKTAGVKSGGVTAAAAETAVSHLREGGAAVRDVAGAARGAAGELKDMAAAAGGAINPLRGMAALLSMFTDDRPAGRRRAGPPVPAPSGGSRAEQAMRYFVGQGWTPEQAAGLVANISRESGFDHRIPGDGGQAYGLAQWHPDRQAEFEKRFGKSIKGSSFEEQLAFIQYELTEGKEAPAGRRLRGARTAGEAGSIVSQYYERPLDRAGEASERGALAQKVVVDINLKGAAQGTTALVRGDPGVGVSMNVARALPGAG